MNCYGRARRVFGTIEGVRTSETVRWPGLRRMAYPKAALEPFRQQTSQLIRPGGRDLTVKRFELGEAYTVRRTPRNLVGEAIRSTHGRRSSEK